MVRALERHHAGTAGREQRRLERDLDRVGARGAEHGARRAAAGEAGRQRLQQRHLHCGGMHVAHRVQQRALLRRERLDHARVRVPDVRDAEARAEIDVAVAVRVPDVRARRALPEDGRLGRERRHVSALDGGEPRRQRARTRAGHGRHQAGGLGLGHGGGV